jgi:hypothetical protein
MARTITSQGRQKGKAKERSKDVQPAGPKKKRRELVPLVVGSYLTHNPLMSLACKS